MPHLILEYSNNLPAGTDVPVVLRRLHDALAALGPFDVADIKSRAVAHNVFVAGSGASDAAFVHVELAILSGRDPETRRAAGAALLDVLREELAELYDTHPCSLTVEVREMDRASYAKDMNARARGD